VQALEKMVRFHLASLHFGETYEEWCTDTNRDRLLNILSMLLDLYSRAKRLEDESDIVKNEPEFTFYHSVFN
jgi:SAC3/GANP family